MITTRMKRILILLLASAPLCFGQESRLVPRHNRHDETYVVPNPLLPAKPTSAPRVTPTPRPRPSPAPRPPLVEPHFLLPANPDVNDYRPVVNAEGTRVIFERNPTASPNDIKLYSLDLSTGDVQPFVTFASTRADWCWDRSGGQLTSGPVAFSNETTGIWTVATGGQPVHVPNTEGMIYPSWYPDCGHLAVDVTGPQVTAEIDATTGTVIASPLANETVWAGFPSVNQTNPNLIAFAGQFNGESNYYNQDLNYVWVTDRSTVPPAVAPLDRKAPEARRSSKNFRHAPGGGHRMAIGLPLSPIGSATKTTAPVRPMLSSFKMRTVRDRQCKSATARRGMFSIRNGFHRDRTAGFCSSLQCRQSPADRSGLPVSM
jgi:hypothetical protein